MVPIIRNSNARMVSARLALRHFRPPEESLGMGLKLRRVVKPDVPAAKSRQSSARMYMPEMSFASKPIAPIASAIGSGRCKSSMKAKGPPSCSFVFLEVSFFPEPLEQYVTSFLLLPSLYMPSHQVVRCKV